MQVLKSSSLMKPGPASAQFVTGVRAADSCAAVVLTPAHKRAVAAPIARVSRATTFNPLRDCRPRLFGYPKLARLGRFGHGDRLVNSPAQRIGGSHPPLRHTGMVTLLTAT